MESPERHLVPCHLVVIFFTLTSTTTSMAAPLETDEAINVPRQFSPNNQPTIHRTDGILRSSEMKKDSSETIDQHTSTPYIPANNLDMAETTVQSSLRNIISSSRSSRLNLLSNKHVQETDRDIVERKIILPESEKRKVKYFMNYEEKMPSLFFIQNKMPSKMFAASVGQSIQTTEKTTLFGEMDHDVTMLSRPSFTSRMFVGKPGDVETSVEKPVSALNRRKDIISNFIPEINHKKLISKDFRGVIHNGKIPLSEWAEILSALDFKLEPISPTIANIRMMMTETLEKTSKYTLNSPKINEKANKSNAAALTDVTFHSVRKSQGPREKVKGTSQTSKNKILQILPTLAANRADHKIVHDYPSATISEPFRAFDLAKDITFYFPKNNGRIENISLWPVVEIDERRDQRNHTHRFVSHGDHASNGTVISGKSKEKYPLIVSNISSDILDTQSSSVKEEEEEESVPLKLKTPIKDDLNINIKTDSTRKAKPLFTKKLRSLFKQRTKSYKYVLPNRKKMRNFKLGIKISNNDSGFNKNKINITFFSHESHHDIDSASKVAKIGF